MHSIGYLRAFYAFLRCAHDKASYVKLRHRIEQMFDIEQTFALHGRGLDARYTPHFPRFGDLRHLAIFLPNPASGHALYALYSFFWKKFFLLINFKFLI